MALGFPAHATALLLPWDRHLDPQYARRATRSFFFIHFRIGGEAQAADPHTGGKIEMVGMSCRLWLPVAVVCVGESVGGCE